MNALSPRIISPTQPFGKIAERTFAIVTSIIQGELINIYAGNSVISIDPIEINAEQRGKLEASVGKEIEFYRDGDKQFVKIALGGEIILDRSANTHMEPLRQHPKDRKKD